MSDSTLKQKSAVNLPLVLLAASLVAGSLAGCASSRNQNRSDEDRGSTDTSSVKIQRTDTSESSSGYGGSGIGGSDYDPAITGENGNYYDTLNEPYLYPGTGIPNVPGTGGTRYPNGMDSLRLAPPDSLSPNPDSSGTTDFDLRG